MTTWRLQKAIWRQRGTMPRRALTGDVQDALNEELLRHPDWTPIQVHKELVRRYGNEAPSARTVQRAARELSTALPSDLWTVQDADTDEFPVVAPVMAFMVSDSEGGIRRFSKAEAAWMARL